MSAVDTKFYEKKKQNTLLVALVFLVFVILLSGGLFVYNNSLEKKAQSLSQEISALESSIESIEKKREIQAYMLYDRNSQILMKQECNSKITTFITHLKRNVGKYSLAAKGFAYSDGNIQTEVSASSDDTLPAYTKIVNFLSNYPQEESPLFVINPIGEFSGYDRINFSPTFTLNPKIYENCIESE